MHTTPYEARDIAKEEIAKFSDTLEARLAVALRKALDTVVTEMEDRVHDLEQEHSRVLRHLGLEDSDGD